MSSWLEFIIVMPPQGACGLKTTSSLKSTPKSKKRKSEGMAAKIIDIMKQRSGDENIKLGDSVPVVELDKIDSIRRWKNMPPPDTPGLIVSAYAPDEETKAAAEVLKMLQKQQPTAGPHGSLNLSTPPGEAEYFKGGGLVEMCRRCAIYLSLSCLHQSHLQVWSPQ